MNNKTDSAQNGRRQFLAEAGKIAGGSWLAMNAPLVLAAAQSAEEQRVSGKDWQNITPNQALGLEAVVDQIIPADDLPGASDAGVVFFIDQALSGFASELSASLKDGMADLDQRALAASPGSGGFAKLRFEKQTAILEQIDTSLFFNQMIFLTHCGMFAMPSWGGNLNKTGWALLGFDNRHAWQPPFGYYDAQAIAEGGDNAF